MLIPNHPDDERLSALAWHDADARADDGLTSHVSSCIRCADLVNELGALRASLADLPDVAPSRPLRLLPPVEAEPAPAIDRLGGWARRYFAPVLASGAALALVGTIGTAAPNLGSGAASAPTLEMTEQDGGGDAAAQPAPEEGAPAAEGAASDGSSRDVFAAAPSDDTDAESLAADDPDETTTAAVPDNAVGTEPAAVAERSPWPMVLFAGVALMIGALLLRWIVVPRAG